ncbi:MAG TPA: FAD-dependent oxidoreductase [Candidatus Merdivicinus excrementipullorum]|uniref:FAD-dependent oxidoreductase n=1 Tax=Candidatus Merdivicinus excrementipullorum TaxID=2840867 RepID=A0A9D1FMF8_9FIRM|nr:FAD-dependent oxidoreductase [Candidatus Merdivicinus excrementipullorum]
MMKVLIVGGVAGGASAATRLRRLDEKAEIILFEKGPYISYANCGLPYYIGGEIKERENLLVTKPALLRGRFGIDVRTDSEVVSIDRRAKTVTVQNHQTGETYTESYDKLLLSPGASPKKPDWEGVNLPGIFTIRNVPDTCAVDDFIRETGAKRAAVVGGGFIGVEMAENLTARGLSVTLMEYQEQVLPPLDPEMAAIVHTHLRQNGVNLALGTAVSGFEKAGTGILVKTGKGDLETDLVILSVGVAPDSGLAKEAGLELGIGGSIAVNDNYQTSDPDIYAVGDAIQVRSRLTGQDTLLPLAGPANRQGRAAAESILGRKPSHSRDVLGSSILKVFQLTAAGTGLNEKQLKAAGIPYLKTYTHPASHAGYYPGGTPMSLKLLFGPDGKVFGAQAVGQDGVDKRMDVLATVIRLGGTVYDLQDLELCYAPPYSAAKDPVNMLGFTAANLLNGDMKDFYCEDLAGLDLDKVFLLDCRTPAEFAMGTIPGAVNIPLDELRNRLEELPKDKPVYEFCQVGLRGYIAYRILTQHGFEVYNLSGGYKSYAQARELYQKPSPVDCVGLPK